MEKRGAGEVERLGREITTLFCDPVDVNYDRVLKTSMSSPLAACGRGAWDPESCISACLIETGEFDVNSSKSRWMSR